MPIRRWDKSKLPTGPWTLNKDCPQAQGLVAWFPMGGATSAKFAPDMAGRFPLSGTTSGMTLGDAGQPAISFASASSHLMSNAALAFTAYPCSIIGWAKPITSANHSIACMSSNNGAVGAGRKLLYIGTDYSMRAFDQNGVGGTQAITTVVGAVNTWFQSAAVFTSQTSRDVYINGANAVNNAVDTGAFTNGLDTRVGNDASGGNFFNGDIGEVMLYNIAVSASVIARTADLGTRFELWYPLRSRKWISIGGAGAALAANAVAMASATSALSTQIVLAATPAAQATATAALATQILLSAAASAQATATAALNTAMDPATTTGALLMAA